MILVTGATGFVGRHVVRELLPHTRRVRAMVRDARGAAALAGLDCELVRGDVTDPASVIAAVRGCRTVVHLVGIISGSPSAFDAVIGTGTRNVVRAAAETGARRVVHMSALGTSPETARAVPYFRTKLQAEETVIASGISHTILRPSFVFGSDGGSLPLFTRIARLAPVTPVIGKGTQRFQPIWVEDLARAVRLAVQKETDAPTLVELGGPDVVDWNAFWGLLKRSLGTSRPTLHVPAWFLRPQAALFELLPRPLLTRDQLRMLELGDNVVTDGGTSARALGLSGLVGLDEQLRRGVGSGG
ncbi:MAG: complex I NDUFA9 subunit family protein [Gaiella sp.]